MNVTALIPNMITIGNLICGIMSIILALQGDSRMAIFLVFVGMSLDYFDGKIARLTKSTSKWGGYLDSCADVVSFGIAPMVLVYAMCPAESRDEMLLFFVLYAICGAVRLIRYTFNMRIHKGEPFLGLPIPAAAGIVSTLMLVCLHTGITFPFTFVAGIIVFSAMLMITTIPYLHFSKIVEAIPKGFRVVFLTVFLISFLTGYYYALLFLLFMSYAVFGMQWKTFDRVRAYFQENTNHKQ